MATGNMQAFCRTLFKLKQQLQPPSLEILETFSSFPILQQCLDVRQVEQDRAFFQYFQKLMQNEKESEKLFGRFPLVYHLLCNDSTELEDCAHSAFVNGPIALTHLKSEKHDMEIYLLGETHTLESTCQNQHNNMLPPSRLSMPILEYLCRLLQTTTVFVDLFIENPPVLRSDGYQTYQRDGGNSVLTGMPEYFTQAISPHARLFRVHHTDVRDMIFTTESVDTFNVFDHMPLLRQFIEIGQYEDVYAFLINNQSVLQKQLDRCKSEEMRTRIEHYAHDQILKLCQEIADAITANDTTQVAHKGAYLLAVTMDVYTLARLFHAPFQKGPTDHFQYPCNMRNIIVYAGNAHVEVYRKFLIEYCSPEEFTVLSQTQSSSQTDTCLDISKIPQPFFRSHTFTHHLPHFNIQFDPNKSASMDACLISPFRPEYAYPVMIETTPSQIVVTFVNDFHKKKTIDFPNVFALQVLEPPVTIMYQSNVFTISFINSPPSSPVQISIELCINDFDKMICKSPEEFLTLWPVRSGPAQYFLQAPEITLTPGQEGFIHTWNATHFAIQPQNVQSVEPIATYDTSYNPWLLKLFRNIHSQKWKSPPFMYAEGVHMLVCDIETCAIVRFEIANILSKNTCDQKIPRSHPFATAADCIVWYVDTTPDFLHIVFRKTLKHTNNAFNRVRAALNRIPYQKRLFRILDPEDWTVATLQDSVKHMNKTFAENVPYFPNQMRKIIYIDSNLEEEFIQSPCWRVSNKVLASWRGEITSNAEAQDITFTPEWSMQIQITTQDGQATFFGYFMNPMLHKIELEIVEINQKYKVRSSNPHTTRRLSLQWSTGDEENETFEVTISILQDYVDDLDGLF